MKKLECLIIIFLIIGGIAWAESVAQDAIQFKWRPSNPWHTTDCENVCNAAITNLQANCRVQCTQIIAETNQLNYDLNGTYQGDFWFNQTHNNADES